MTLGFAFVVGACGDDDVSSDGGEDVGSVDARVILDSEFVPDGFMRDATVDGSVGSDASSDAFGSDTLAPLCPGSCRPDEGICGAAGACVLQTAEPMCVSTAGRLPLGSPCESVDQCMVGLACFAGPSGGLCGRVCCLEDAVCDEGEECGGLGQLIDGTDTAYGQCRLVRSCSVFDSTSCDEGEACYITADGESACLAEGPAEVSEPCEGINDCVRGLQCVGAFESTCQRLCRIGLEECGSSETCRATAELPEGAGLCSPMSSARRM